MEINKAPGTITATIVGDINLGIVPSTAYAQVRVSPAGSATTLDEQTVHVSLPANVTVPVSVTLSVTVPEGDYDVYPSIVVHAPAQSAPLTINANANVLAVGVC